MPVIESEEMLLIALRARGSREAAFRKLVTGYGPALHRHLLRMLHSSSDVDDVLQNTFVKIYRNLDGFRGESKLSTWLYRIATNEAINWLRKSRRRSVSFFSEDPGKLSESQLRADPFFDGDAAEAQLQVAISTLPVKQKAVFVLRYFEEKSYREISEITGTSVGGLKASYHLAAKKIEKNLQAYVGN